MPNELVDGAYQSVDFVEGYRSLSLRMIILENVWKGKGKALFSFYDCKLLLREELENTCENWNVLLSGVVTFKITFLHLLNPSKNP